jgi:hypothetical protein
VGFTGAATAVGGARVWVPKETSESALARARRGRAGFELPAAGALWQDLRHDQIPQMAGRSDALNAFVARCMRREPTERPTAVEILAMEMVSSASAQSDTFVERTPLKRAFGGGAGGGGAAAAGGGWGGGFGRAREGLAPAALVRTASCGDDFEDGGSGLLETPRAQTTRPWTPDARGGGGGGGYAFGGASSTGSGGLSYSASSFGSDGRRACGSDWSAGSADSLRSGARQHAFTPLGARDGVPARVSQHDTVRRKLPPQTTTKTRRTGGAHGGSAAVAGGAKMFEDFARSGDASNARHTLFGDP